MINVVLYQIEIPQNLGNIIRTLMAFECNLIIIGKLKFSLDEKSFKRAKMDYALDYPIKFYDTFDDFYKSVKKNSQIYYITRYADKCYSEVSYKDIYKDYYLVFGRESTGLPYDILKNNFENCLRIPMTINARSLNLSNCVAIVTSEVLRQQNFNNLATRELLKGEDFIKNS